MWRWLNVRRRKSAEKPAESRIKLNREAATQLHDDLVAYFCSGGGFMDFPFEVVFVTDQMTIVPQEPQPCEVSIRTTRGTNHECVRLHGREDSEHRCGACGFRWED